MTAPNPLVRLGIQLPIIQAAMAGVSTPAMAAAVTNAGGLGSISVGATDALGAIAMIDAVRKLTSGPFNVNVFCHQPAISNAAVEGAWIERFRPVFAEFGAAPPPALTEIYRSFIDDEAMYQLLRNERPAVISFHFGLPRPDWIDGLRAAKTVLLATVTSVIEACAAAAAGVDAVVAQGWEAGGHRGVFDPDAPDDRHPTLTLVGLINRELDIPIIAAGGIMTGAHIAAALDAGAAAVQMGTAFIATDESVADPAYRQAMAGDDARHTLVSRAISGRPARGLPTRFTAFAADVEAEQVPAYPLAYDLGKALHAAALTRGEPGFGVRWAGTGVAQVRAIPVEQLMRVLETELHATQVARKNG